MRGLLVEAAYREKAPAVISAPRRETVPKCHFSGRTQNEHELSRVERAGEASLQSYDGFAPDALMPCLIA